MKHRSTALIDSYASFSSLNSVLTQQIKRVEFKKGNNIFVSLPVATLLFFDSQKLRNSQRLLFIEFPSLKFSGSVTPSMY